MTLPPGTRLGAYEVIGPIGAGGMGEVYRARDVRLERDVAIKVLPAAVSADADRLIRFEREARTLASLNHPNIAQVHGTIDQPPALVMELVEGEDLSALIARGLPVDEATGLAAQIAAALEEAHERGVIHRDLKPGNVKVRADGTVKVLDFGLAKAIEPAGSPSDAVNSPTMTSPVTQMGVILGTAAYMAPEQAKGRPVDKRADVWAFGVVLYEMLTGRQPFNAPTVTETLAAVLRADVDLEALPSDVPPGIRRLLARCLERDPRNRLRDIGEARILLASGDSAAAAAAPGAPRRTSRATWFAAGAAAGAAAALVISATVFKPAEPAPAVSARFLLRPPDGTAFLSISPPAVSADGSRIVFAAAESPDVPHRLYFRALDQPEAIPISGVTSGIEPFLSPDGQWVGFFDFVAGGGTLFKVPLGGGQPSILSEAGEPRGGAWRSDGSIVFAPRAYGGLVVIPSDGGSAQPFTTPDAARGELSHRYPVALPDGRVAFSILTSDPTAPAIGVVDRAGGRHRTLIAGAHAPQFVSTGHLVFAKANPVVGTADLPSSSSIAAVEFDGTRVRTEEIAVAGNVAAVQAFGVAHYAVSPSGTLVTLAHEPALRRLLWVGLDGAARQLPLGPGDYADARVSPDGRQIALVSRAGEGELVIYDSARDLAETVPAGITHPAGPVWSADGRALVVGGLRQGVPGVLRVTVGRTTSPERLTAKPVHARPSDWRGDAIILGELSMTTRSDISTLRAGEDAPHRVLESVNTEDNGRLSPDGGLLAYERGSDVYVQPFPGPGPVHRVSRAGGWVPLWARDGRTLFYQAGDDVLATEIAADGTPGQTRAILRAVRGGLQDVAPDGRKFLFLVPEAQGRPATPLTVTLGWLERALSPTRR